jgi:hypothetical protein
MATTMVLTGDVNLMNITDPMAPFALVQDELRAAGLVFSNLECCLYAPPDGHSWEREGFFADPILAGEALGCGGIAAVGLANNVNYGETAIMASIDRLDRLGIAHAGAGADREAARAPAIVIRDGLRFGFLQRSSVYWPTNHEASANAPGIAVLRGHTAYQVPTQGSRPPANRPGVPPRILTWGDPEDLRLLAADIAALRTLADVVVASFHWGLSREVLQYMKEIGHAAIDAGADLVVGHGPHFSLPIEIYRGKPIFYGLGSFSFHTGHGGVRHGDWLGMMARISWAGSALDSAAFQFVRHDAQNRTVPRTPKDEAAALDEIARESAAMGARLTADADRVRIKLRA